MEEKSQAIRKDSVLLLLLLYLYHHHPTTQQQLVVILVDLSYPTYYLAMNPHPLNHQPQTRTFIIPREQGAFLPSHHIRKTNYLVKRTITDDVLAPALPGVTQLLAKTLQLLSNHPSIHLAHFLLAWNLLSLHVQSLKR
ncbi:hypothetical protein V8C43DRAFT_268882 [Trichoderma afarasin]